MKIKTDYREKVIYIFLQGEVDEHGVSALRKEADRWIDEYALHSDKAIFDLKAISFMDSTGIGFLIGRYKKLCQYGVVAYICNPSIETDRILTMSGIYTLMPKM